MRTRHTHIAMTLCAAMAVACLASCASDGPALPELPEEQDCALSLSPAISGMEAAQTRGEDELTKAVDVLRENYMGQRLDVFVEGINGTSFWKHYWFDESVEQKYYLLEKNWTANYDPNGKYRVYVTVNQPDEVQGVMSAAGLKAATITDDNIFTQYTSRALTADEVNTGYYTNNKVFPMDGVLDWDFSTGSLTKKLLDVQMKRAAAKIVLDLSFTDKFKAQLQTDGYTIGTPMSRTLNLNYKTAVLQGGDAVEPDLRNGWLIGIPKREDAGDSYRLITYSFAFDWSDDPQGKAPGLVVSVGYNKNTGDDDENITSEINYYRIPVTASAVTAFERNHVYHVTAMIDSYGATSVQEEVEEVLNLQYEVLPWTDGNETTVVQVDKEMNFLMVTPTYEEMFGENPEPALIEYYAAGGSTVKIETTEIYYYDANGNKITASGSGTGKSSWWKGATITKDPDNRLGTITVKSDVLANKAVKFIKFRVYLDDDDDGQPDENTEHFDVTVKHYPLDNIQNTPGLWSSRTTSGWWDPSNLTGSWWNTTNPEGYGIGYDGSLFYAKYYYNNSYMRIARNTTASTSHNWYSQTTLTNNKKYVIQITESSNKFALGKVTLDGNNQSTDHVVSPAFMIASQLGATSSQSPRDNNIASTARTAANHCSTYKEVDVDGTVWAGWRLPTREEIGEILRYQNAGYDTMLPVMTGRYYWTLEGAAVATGINNEDYLTWYNNWETRYSDTSYDYKDGSGNTYIRCIRDLTPDEVKTLNNKSN